MLRFQIIIFLIYVALSLGIPVHHLGYDKSADTVPTEQTQPNTFSNHNISDEPVGSTEIPNELISRKSTTDTNEIKNDNVLILLHSGTRKSDSTKKNATPKKEMKYINKDSEKKIFFDDRKQHSEGNLDAHANGKNHYSAHSHLSLRALQVDQRFHSSWPKYMREGMVVLPPFPELSDRGDYSVVEKTDTSESNFNSGILSRRAKNSVETPKNENSDENSRRSENRSISSEDDISSSEIENLKLLESSKFLFSPQEEFIFQPLPFRKYDTFEPVPPFAELHKPSRNYQHVLKKETEVRDLVPAESNVPERAGPELYPSSAFESELRVPFF